MSCCPRQIKPPNSGNKNPKRQNSRWELHKQRIIAQEKSKNKLTQESSSQNE